MLAAAAHAAGLQGRFWEMHDSLLEDQGHLDDPHLGSAPSASASISTASRPDRRSEGARERVELDFRGGIRAGVTTTPTQFVAGRPHPGVPGDDFAPPWAPLDSLLLTGSQ